MPQISLQSKEMILTQDTELEVTPDMGFDALSSLQIAVGDEYVDSSMAHMKTLPRPVLPTGKLSRVGARAVAWNQLAVTKSGIARTNQYHPMFSGNDFYSIAGHKYLFSCLVPANCLVYRQNAGGITVTGAGLNPTVDTVWDFIGTASNTGQIPTGQLHSIVSKNQTTEIAYALDNMQIFDLTAMGEYDSTLTDAQNIARFRALFPASYYPYNAGEIIPLNPTGFKVVGRNLAESISQASGSNPYGVVLFAEAELQPSTTYTISFVGANGNKLYSNENLFESIATITCNGTRQSRTVTTKANISRTNTSQYQNGGWMLFKNASDNTVNPSFTDVQIEKGSTATAYEEYKETAIDTSFTEDYLYVNESCHDYSENILVDGVMRREEHLIVGSYTFTGNEGWSYTSREGNYAFYASIQGKANGEYNLTSPIYATAQEGYTYPSGLMRDKTCCGGTGSNSIFFKDDSFGYDANGLALFKAYITGKTIYFELATPSTPTLHDPIPNLPVEDGTTVEAVTPQTELVNAIDVPFTVEVLAY